MHEVIPRRADERRHRHVTAVVRKQITLNLSDGYAVIRDRRAARQGAQIGRLQRKEPPVRVRRQNRRLVESNEAPLCGAIAARIHFDVGARHYGGKPRDSAHTHVRRNDVEAGIFVQERRRLARHACADEHSRQVRCQLDGVNRPDVHIAMLDLRLPRQQPLGDLEFDGDHRASIRQRAPCQPDNDAGRDDGDGPDPREPTPSLHPRFNFLLTLFGHTASHMSRVSKTLVATIVTITTAAKATSPFPACTSVNAPKRRAAINTDTANTSMFDQRPTRSIIR